MGNGLGIMVSVIVTVYNIEKYIRTCLDSILNQEEVNLECICVDDVSTDGSYEILKEYAEKDQRIKLIKNSENMGLSSSRNIGFRNATGEYLYNIDGDDYLKPGALKRLYTCAKENNLDLLGFSAISFFEDESMREFGREDEYVRKGKYEYVKTGAELFADLISNGDRASSNMVLYFYRRDYFEGNKLYGIEGLRYGDDSMFAMYMAAQRAMCIPDQLYMRRYREGSTCTSPLKKRYMESLIVLFLEELQIWQRSNLNDQLNEKIEKYFNMRLRSIRFFLNKFKDDTTRTSFLDTNVMAKYFYQYFLLEEPIYKDILSTEQIRDIKNADTVILYGAGYIAGEVAKVLEFNGIVKYKVAVTDKATNTKKFRGENVYNINELKCQKEKTFVIVAMSKKNYNVVTKILNSLKYQKVLWLTL